MIHIVDNFLPGNLFQELLQEKVPWRYGAKSNSETDPHGHWTHKPYHDKKQNLADLTSLIPESGFLQAWKLVRDKLLPDHKLIRAYRNSYTYGTDGYFHSDSDDQRHVTSLLYVVPTWDDDWAGETLVRDGNNTFLACIPKPNRLLVFFSKQPHCARAVSRKCTELRSVIVLKSRPAYSAYFEKLSGWLVANRALSYKHGKNGTLHDHLVRCYELCERKRLPLPICLGAGLHSIYGTNSFHHRLFEPSEPFRGVVAEAFGKEAETLAHAFSILDRPRALENTGSELSPIRLMEAANLLDQGSLDKWPAIKAAWDSVRT